MARLPESGGHPFDATSSMCPRSFRFKPTRTQSALKASKMSAGGPKRASRGDLGSAIAWNSPELHGAGTVHLGADERAMFYWAADLAAATIPRNPFLLLGQMTTADKTRSPEGTESAWAYTVLPRGVSEFERAGLELAPSRLVASSASAWTWMWR